MSIYYTVIAYRISDYPFEMVKKLVPQICFAQKRGGREFQVLLFFFLNLAKNRVLGIFCFFEIVRKSLGEGMSNSEIQKYFEINFKLQQSHYQKDIWIDIFIFKENRLGKFAKLFFHKNHQKYSP